jgi:hypothetical protein
MVWLNLLDQGSRLFGINSETAWAIVLVMAAVHLVIGGLAGWFAWGAGRQLQIRMGKSPVEAAQA